MNRNCLCFLCFAPVLLVLLTGLVSCSPTRVEESGQSDRRALGRPLACEISSSSPVYAVGEPIEVHYTIKNTGKAEIALPLYHVEDNNKKKFPLVSDELRAVPLSLEITSDDYGSLNFDNFGFRTVLPLPTVVRIPEGKTLTGRIMIDETACVSVVLASGKRKSLGGIGQNGLNTPGRYNLRLRLRPEKEQFNILQGELISNKIEISIVDKNRNIQPPATANGEDAAAEP